jgi:hypothetical protein
LFCAGGVLADTQAFYSYQWQGEGSLMASPIVYTGTFISGFSGTWTITVDDSAWPDSAKVPYSDARFNYIWQHFFAANYDSTGPLSWTGYFNASTLGEQPGFEFNITGSAYGDNGTVGGGAPFSVLVMDNTPNGVLDAWEWDNLRFAANLNINPGVATGTFVGYCGWGAMNATDFDFPSPYDAVDYVGYGDLPGSGNLFTSLCPSATEPAGWGKVKSLFRVAD